MTLQRSDVGVADDVLAEATRKITDFLQRFVKGSLNPKRSLHILQLALEGVPSRPFYSSTADAGVYVLESTWAWDNSHIEHVTFSFEAAEGRGMEAIISPDMEDSSRKKRLLRQLRKVFDAQVSGPGARMRRLYRVHNRSRFSTTSETPNGVERTCDLHFVMVPICDFDMAGNPIACTSNSDHL